MKKYISFTPNLTSFSLDLLIKYGLFAMVLIVSISCDSADETDTEKPVIDLSRTDAFPTSCATIYFDEPFNFKAYFSDNFALGSYSIDIHNNFDHHSHSTEDDDCTLDDKKTATNPYVFINDYEIPENSSSYEANLTMTIPSSDASELFQEGDYHFYISLTDKEGWSTHKGLSIKILHK
ncbi:MAG: DUF4625 domain-containing protein [Cytophagales bacterium]|uniref:DUF4625 domain-containing protein n=1 Tax=Cyclobacterium marinum TaxID=104 RepID=UPI0030D825EB|nr:DUF4625 domain-containing protein [Cytophagales bacterium]|tara:strand:- start:66609 stop:67145 length:537 start_codon:yes stop_codon:yes gene_type:complete